MKFVWRLAAVASVAALALTGCAPAAPNPSRYVGDTLDIAMQSLNSPDVIDITPNVANQPPSYNAGQDGSAWVVLVGCYEDNPQQTSDLGVIPKADATDAIIANAKAGDYDKYVSSCAP